MNRRVLRIGTARKHPATGPPATAYVSFHGHPYPKDAADMAMYNQGWLRP